MKARIILLVALLIYCPILSGQERPVVHTTQTWGVPDQPLNCEMNLQNLEYVRTFSQEQKTGFLIIVARLGSKETRREMNSRRLYNVRLKLTLIGVQPDRIIVAEGERVRGFGRVEFYLRGEMVGALPVAQEKDICVGCCDPDERFYPYKRKWVGVKRKHATNATWDNTILMSPTESLGHNRIKFCS